MADLYSEGRLKMTKNAFFATLSLNILRTASNNILKLGTVLDGMYIYHHAKFQVNRCNFEGARPFPSLGPNVFFTYRMNKKNSVFKIST